ncbi:phosphatase PAP2 family protein [Gehongia tenuis]|uniref:Phosphatase PAP2 family protein n=1 Tax=Gehongia tenuis TaxID=2763655 RepID=A0A926D604_9FIRM|nr:phosphatase PAP2 family protein [Gehongia tenuis]MBC8532072.1 phosphatase PAP2 family protein [Gehongia tenuis]
MEVIAAVQSIASPFWDAFFEAVTRLAEDGPALFILALLLWCIDHRGGMRIALTFAAGAFVTSGLKLIFRIPRPWERYGDALRTLHTSTATGYSFPSGHSTQAASFAGGLAGWAKRGWFTLLMVMLALLVGLSRIYLGAHTLWDVIAGLAIGFGVVPLCGALLDWLEKNHREKLLFIAVIPLFVLGCLGDGNLAKSSGLLSGLLMGYVLMPAIGFQSQAPIWQQVLKMVLGIAVLLALQLGLRALFPGGAFFSTLHYFLLGLWGCAGAPWLFMKLGLTRASRAKR